MLTLNKIKIILDLQKKYWFPYLINNVLNLFLTNINFFIERLNTLELKYEGYIEPFTIFVILKMIMFKI